MEWLNNILRNLEGLFTEMCIRDRAPTKDFSAWLDYIKQSISSKRKNEQEEQSSFYGCLLYTSGYIQLSGINGSTCQNKEKQDKQNCLFGQDRKSKL